jgi:peptidoglycan/LPS O-acetylase OafA/YrhL
VPDSNTRTSSYISGPYIPGLDGIRALAFLLVFWAHALPGIAYYIPATLGVTIFFFLSGYLITTLLRREFAATGTLRLGDFYLRRTLRIFVPLYIVTALVVLIAPALHLYPGNARGIFAVVAYIYNYVNIIGWTAFAPAGLTVVWSLAVEEHFYLLFPPALRAIFRHRWTQRSQATLLLSICLLELLWRSVLVFVLHDWRMWTYFATDARLDSILWGCILALIHNPVFAGDRSILPRNPATRLSVFLTALLLLIATLVPRSYAYRETLRYTLQGILLYVIFACVIETLRHPASGKAVAWLEWLPLRYLGWISYTLYLAHDFITQAVQLHLPGRLWLSAPIAFAVSIAFATAMRYTVELPIQRLRARLRPPVPVN